MVFARICRPIPRTAACAAMHVPRAHNARTACANARPAPCLAMRKASVRTLPPTHKTAAHVAMRALSEAPASRACAPVRKGRFNAAARVLTWPSITTTAVHVAKTASWVRPARQVPAHVRLAKSPVPVVVPISRRTSKTAAHVATIASRVRCAYPACALPAP